MEAGRRPYLRSLEGIRAYAFLMVFAVHFSGYKWDLRGRSFTAYPWLVLLQLSFVAVPIFFALSGYLITTILLGLRKRSTPYKTFYARRIVRIFPPYFAVFFAVILFALAFDRRSDVLQAKSLFRQVFFLQAYFGQYIPFLKDHLLHLRWYATHPPSMLSLAHHLPAGVSGLQPDLGAQSSTFWSLSIEEYFYLLWAPIVLHFERRTVILIGVLVCVTEVTLRWYYPDSLAYFGLFFRFDGLIYGAFLALLIADWKSKGTPTWARSLFSSLLWVPLGGVGVMLFLLRPVVGYEIRASPLLLSFGLSCLSIAIAALLGTLILKANTRWWLARLVGKPGLRVSTTGSALKPLISGLPACLLLCKVADQRQLVEFALACLEQGDEPCQEDAQAQHQVDEHEQQEDARDKVQRYLANGDENLQHNRRQGKPDRLPGVKTHQRHTVIWLEYQKQNGRDNREVGESSGRCF